VHDEGTAAARLNLKAIEERVAPLGGRESYDRDFIFELLLAYGKPQGNVTRLRNGSLSVAMDPESEVAQKNVVYFKETTDDPLAVIDELKTSPADRRLGHGQNPPAHRAGHRGRRARSPGALHVGHPISERTRRSRRR
jgi:hypothetical protein